MMKEKFTPFTVGAGTRNERVERNSHRSYSPARIGRSYDAQTIDRKQLQTTEGEEMALNKNMQQVPVERTRRVWRVVPQKKRPSTAQKWLKQKRATQVRKFHRGMMIWSQKFDLH